MKQIKNSLSLFVVYVIFGIIVMVTTSKFTRSEETAMFWLQLIMGFFSLCVILFYTLKFLKNKSKYSKKKFYIYSSIFLIEILLIKTISYAFNVSTRNTWLALIGLDVIFITIGILFLDIAQYIKNIRKTVAFLLYFAAVFIALTIIIVNIGSFMYL